MPKVIKIKSITPIADIQATLGHTLPKFVIKDWELTGQLVSEIEISQEEFKRKDYCLTFVDLSKIGDLRLALGGK